MQDVEATQAADAAAAAAGASAVFLLFVYFIVGVVYAIVVYVIARKRRVNPWPWTIATLIPAIGLLVAAIFYLLSFLSVLDRLNKLEGEAQFS
ncbi:MAG: hypothetical protein JNL41_18625 [Phenylobacterium sp.]|uniref:hypothetical protein n=1 Tax=Phenylobacterium sp. TaxID=1871053 RepID=UPI001A3855D6|nr:hypothetical protein [Phenylobacterium sp.]MBL8556296.1 hypothetical protein [Phenylobacterium sp.]